MTSRFLVRGATTVLFTLVLAVAAFAQMPGGGSSQMPDAKSMSGMPLPVPDVQPGTVVVRVIRGSLANVITGQQVELLGAGAPRKMTTNDTGRAEFTNLPIGTRVQAVTTVNGEKLESQEFEVPASGGVRLMLVATDPELEKKAAEDRKLAQGPAQPGMVVLGEQSRFVFEMGDDALSAFYIMQVTNTARVPVQTPQPLVFELPADARGASILEGSSPQATVAGTKVTVNGPFAPGLTLVQVGFSLPYSSGDLTVEQKLPAAMTQLTVIAQKVGAMHVASAQFSNHRDMSAEGQSYILGEGPALKAGDVVTLNFTGLPHAPTWPRNLALALAVVILVAGVWSSMRGGRMVAADEARRRKLEGRRDRLFGELTALEQQHRDGLVDEQRYGSRRGELVSALERIYAEMDEEAAA